MSTHTSASGPGAHRAAVHELKQFSFYYIECVDTSPKASLSASPNKASLLQCQTKISTQLHAAGNKSSLLDILGPFISCCFLNSDVHPRCNTYPGGTTGFVRGFKDPSGSDVVMGCGRHVDLLQVWSCPSGGGGATQDHAHTPFRAAAFRGEGHGHNFLGSTRERPVGSRGDTLGTCRKPWHASGCSDPGSQGGEAGLLSF